MGTITRFIGSLLISLVILNGSMDAEDLRGTVSDSEGNPIPRARIDISTAAPRTGPSLFCPSCYLDCSKWTTSNDEGVFGFQSLDNSLKFRLIATAAGKQTVLTELIDPAKTDVDIRLDAFPTDLPASRVLTGTVLSQEGLPVSGALIEPNSARTNERRWRGKVNSHPAVSDDQGKFRVQLLDDYLGVGFRITAYGFSGTITDLLTPGHTSHALTIASGTSVTGKLTFEDGPAANRQIAVVQVNRGHDDIVFLNAVMATTNSAGDFEVQSLPANEPYAIFSPVSIAAPGPVLTTTLFSAGADNVNRDLGTLELVNGLTLAGRVHIEGGDGKLPDDLQMTLDRVPAWDLIEVPIDDTGHFEIENLPPETYEVRIRSRHVVVDHSRLNYQALGRYSFGMRLTESTSDLVIPIRRLRPSEKIKRPLNRRKAQIGSQSLSGHIVDRNGEPVAGIRISPQLAGGGRLPTRIEIAGRTVRMITRSFSDGRFKLAHLPDEPVELMFRQPNSYGYPHGKSARTILYIGRVRPEINQKNIRIVFDPKLITPPPNLK